MITIDFTGEKNESKQEVGYTKPILDIEEVECFLENAGDEYISLADEAKKYFN